MTFNRSRLAERTKEDEDAALDLDEKGSTIKSDVIEQMLDSAQKSMEESRVRIEKTDPGKQEKKKIDYEMFSLPDEKEEYLKHVNEENRSVMKEEVREGENGSLILHLFSVVTRKI